ncbi:hypothetical protein CTAYLR_001457 [Chrysophaeum taylorii]|uniref:Bromodomain-containing protein n=1 Tax=Chrysophaeum taylorii TaxID=2483200 RepID=A0AAD7U9R4_9STRA|nr:hypothetical protein CTAYLR_001457 [Chrysophaeum taylorii]
MAVPFREPVDWRSLGLYDYPQIIKKPMDLSTVKGNIEKGVYQSVQECAEDVRLIWTNCKKYNQDGSDFYNLADTFSKRFEDKYSKIKTDDPAVEEETDHAPSHEEKIRFSHNIYKIKQEELGQLVEKLEERCSEAMDKSTNEDEIEINIDAIDPKTFHELDRFVRHCIAQAQPKKKKKAASSSTEGGEAKAKKAKQ